MIEISKYTKLDVELNENQRKLSNLILNALQTNHMTIEDLDIASDVVRAIYYTSATTATGSDPGKGFIPLIKCFDYPLWHGREQCLQPSTFE